MVKTESLNEVICDWRIVVVDDYLVSSSTFLNVVTLVVGITGKLHPRIASPPSEGVELAHKNPNWRNFAGVEVLIGKVVWALWDNLLRRPNIRLVVPKVDIRASKINAQKKLLPIITSVSAWHHHINVVRPRDIAAINKHWTCLIYHFLSKSKKLHYSRAKVCLGKGKPKKIVVGTVRHSKCYSTIWPHKWGAIVWEIFLLVQNFQTAFPSLKLKRVLMSQAQIKPRKSHRVFCYHNYSHFAQEDLLEFLET